MNDLSRRRRHWFVWLAAAAALVVALGWWGHSTQQASPAQQFQTALAALDAGDLVTARGIVRQLAEDSTNDRYVRLLRGADLAAAGDDEGALREYSHVQPEGDVREPALLLVSRSLMNRGQLAEAENLLVNAVKVNPDLADAHRYLAVIYYDLGAVAPAMSHLRELARLVPDDYRPHHLMGKIRAAFEEYAPAAEHYRDALERHPPPEAVSKLTTEMARALVDGHEYEAALSALSDISSSIETLSIRCEAQMALGDLDRARQTLGELEALKPPEAVTAGFHAQILQADGRLEDAVQSWRRLLDEQPYNVEARYQLALLYQRLGLMDEYDQSMKLKEHYEQLFLRLSYLSVETSNRPFDIQMRREMADLCDQLGRPEMAAVWRKAVTGLEPITQLQNGEQSADQSAAAGRNPSADKAPAE